MPFSRYTAEPQKFFFFFFKEMEMNNHLKSIRVCTHFSYNCIKN